MGFKRVLIANRGEIALRILRTLRDMGIEAAIIHGREDRLSLPVRLSDVAYPIYSSNPLDSYLNIEAVVNAAKELEWLKGPDRQGLSKRHGKEFIDHQIEIWTKLVGVLKSGEHCPHHIRAKKSLDS